MENRVLNELALLLNSGQYDQARELSSKIAVNDLETISIAVHYLNTAGLISEASKLNLKILKEDPKHLPALVMQGLIARSENNLPEAENYYKKALKIDDTCISALFNLGVLSEIKSEINKAIDYYQQIRKIEFNHAKATTRIAICQQKQNKHKEAIATFEELEDTEQDSATIKYHLGLSYQQIKQLDLALSMFESALMLEADHIPAQHALATIYTELQEYELAVTAYIQTLKLEPKHIEAMHNLASVYYHQKKYKLALDYWMKLLQIQPDNFTNYNIGSCYLALQKHDDAKPYLKAACYDLPQATEPLINLASIYIKTEQWPKVVKLYNRALKIDPDNDEIKYVLAAIENTDNDFTKAPATYVRHLFDHYADSFEKHLVNNLAYKAHILIKEQLTKYLDTNKKYHLLDLGCGTGLCGKECSEFAAYMVGVDLSESMLDEAKKLGLYNELVNSDLEEFLAEKSADFDIIMAADVMPYIGELITTLDLIWQALSAHGYCIFTVESSTNPYLYSLSASGRYQHNPIMLKDLILQKNWEVMSEQEVVTRTQNNEPVYSRLFLLRKPS